jgi:hypothetical protein
MNGAGGYTVTQVIENGLVLIKIQCNITGFIKYCREIDFQVGTQHRVDGPAYISPAGESWIQHGRYHRTDGPSVVLSNGIKRWYVEDMQYTNNRDYQISANLSDEEMTMLILKYGNVT